MKISKNIIALLSILLITLTVVSCKKEAKKEGAKFSIEPTTITVNWTGYKTTDKIAVTGEFKEINITKSSKGATAVDALNGTEFNIPVSSLFSNNDERDTKLKTLFFGIMDATTSLTGILHLEKGGKGSIALTMNGVTNNIPITYVVNEKMVKIEGAMNLDNWNAQNALASLAKACFEQHKGADGVSKTWNEVGVKAIVYLKEK